MRRLVKILKPIRADDVRCLEECKHRVAKTSRAFFLRAHDWIDARYAAGARTLGVSCDANKRQVYIMTDGPTFVLACKTRRHAVIIKDILHEYIRRLPVRGEA